jgi:hypothetical protein
MMVEERVVALVWMLLGTWFFTFLLGMMSSFMSTIDAKGRILAEKLEFIDVFCKQAEIEPSLKRRMKKAMRYHSAQYLFSDLQHTSVLESIPSKLLYYVRLFLSSC